MSLPFHSLQSSFTIPENIVLLVVGTAVIEYTSSSEFLWKIKIEIRAKKRNIGIDLPMALLLNVLRKPKCKSRVKINDKAVKPKIDKIMSPLDKE